MGFLAAVGLIVSRRPDAVTHAQFWAEDGHVYFANVYNHGVLASLAAPQAGYLQEFSVLAAGLAQVVPLARAPLVTNLLAIAVQALPVALLLSKRAAAFAPDIRARALLALLYVAIAGFGEIDANAVNAQWHLVVAAVIVLLLEPPTGFAQHAADGAILLLMGLTGPFTIVLAPVALLLRRWRGAGRGPAAWTVVLLAACAVLQLLCVVGVISAQPKAFFTVRPRLHPALGVSAGLFTKLIGGKVIAAPLIGETSALAQSRASLAIATVLGLAALVWVAVRTGPELRMFLIFGALMLGLSLLSPQASQPAWPSLAEPGGGERYFLLPQLGVLAALVWSASCARPIAIRGIAVGLLIVAAVIAIPTGWRYAPFQPTGFSRSATAFERAPRYTVRTFPIDPILPTRSFEMTLKKQ